MSKKRFSFFAMAVLVLALTLAVTSFAYSTDLYGYVSGLEEGDEYTYAKYDPINDTVGIAKTLDSDTQLGAGIWKITDSDGKSEELFIPSSQSGQITFWDSNASAVASCLAGKSDSFVPGFWTISQDSAFRNMAPSSMKSDTIPTICIYFDKTKVLQLAEGSTGYANATPIQGESNLLQESTVSYGFTADQVVPASMVKSFTINATVVRTGAFLYSDGYSVKDAVGEFTYVVKLPGVEEYETYTIDVSVDENAELTVEAPEAMKSSKGYLVAVTYAPYAKCDDEIYKNNTWDNSATCYVHLGFNKGENKLALEEVSYPAPEVHDGFGIIGVDPDRTFEIAEVQINAKGTGFDFGEWEEYTYSASRERDLVGLYAVRETYNGKVSANAFAYAWGDQTARNEIGTLGGDNGETVLAENSSSFKAGYYTGNYITYYTGVKWQIMSHGQVNAAPMSEAKTAKDNYDALLADETATEDAVEAAREIFVAKTTTLVDSLKKIVLRYTYDRGEVIPVGEVNSFYIVANQNNGGFTMSGNQNQRVVAYVADSKGEINTYETVISQPFTTNLKFTVDFASVLPEEGYLVAFEIYLCDNVSLDNFVEVTKPYAFRYYTTVSPSNYSIDEPEALPASAEKPEGLLWEGGAIMGLDKSKAYEWAPFDINGIDASGWKLISDVTEFDPETSGLVAVKYSGDGYSHNGSEHTYVYIPGNKMYSIINTTPTLKSDGSATIDVLDVSDAGSLTSVRKPVIFNEGRWTGYSLTNALALRYNFDRLVLGSSGTPLKKDYAIAIRDAADDEAKAEARAAAAELSANVYFSYAYKPDEIIAMSDFESFKFKVTIRQTGFALVGTVQTKFVMKVVDENDELVDRVIYKDVDYTKTGTVITVTAEDFTDLSGYIVGMVIFPYGQLGEGSYYDYSSETSGDYAVYLYADGYEVNAITEAEKPELSLTTKNAIIKIENYNEMVSYAYSDGGEWVKFEGDSFAATKASTEYKVKALGNSFFLESAESEPITSPAITVVGTSLVLDGSIGIKLYFDVDTELITDINLHTTKKNLDFADYSSQLAYGEAYRVGGDINFTSGTDWATPATLDADSGLYYVIFHVPAKDVDNTKFETDLGGFLNGTRVCYGNPGIDFTTYVEKAKALATAGDVELIKALDLIEALENYADYADNYFNKGSLDAFETGNTLEADAPAKTGALEGAELYATSLLLEGKITIRHYFKVDDLDAYNAEYTSDIPYGEKDGYIYYDIEDIPAQDMGEPQTLTIKNSEGTAFEIKYSVANYIASASEDSDTRLVSLMNTMSEYYTAAYSYANPKPLYVKYDSSSRTEYTVESIHIYIPTQVGYIDQIFGRTVWEQANADIWRLSLAYAVDDNLENPVQITTAGEWDMALRIVGRPDFVGGHAHGDEITTSIKFIIDGVETDVTTLVEPTEFKTMTIVQDSKGYDPSDNVTHILNHHKEHKVTHAGIRLDQRVEWLGDFELTHSYLAMMPPAKSCTDSFYTNLTEPQTIDLTTGTKYVDGATSATVYGEESGIYFTMTVNEYDTYMKPLFSVSDNGGGIYNKMYFTFVKNGIVEKGDVWETFTHYKIDRKAVK